MIDPFYGYLAALGIVAFVFLYACASGGDEPPEFPSSSLDL